MISAREIHESVINGRYYYFFIIAAADRGE